MHGWTREDRSVYVPRCICISVQDPEDDAGGTKLNIYYIFRDSHNDFHNSPKYIYLSAVPLQYDIYVYLQSKHDDIVQPP